MSVFDTEHAQLGQVAQMVELLQSIRDDLKKAEEWGGVGEITRQTWAAGASAEYAYDGTFSAVGIFNLNAAVIRVSLTPNGALVAGRELFDLSARGFIILPYRGTTVSIANAAGGVALVVTFEVAQPANAGTF